jgi:hypothetical protein
MGAASPGRWQLWQRACNIGATSLVNVRGAVFVCAPAEAHKIIIRSNFKTVSLEVVYGAAMKVDPQFGYSPTARYCPNVGSEFHAHFRIINR